MLELKDIRTKIDVIDDQLLKLFEQRMLLVEQVLDYKLKHNLQTQDQNREKLMEERLSLLIDPKLKNYYLDFLRAYVTISKQYQNDLKNHE